MDRDHQVLLQVHLLANFASQRPVQFLAKDLFQSTNGTVSGARFQAENDRYVARFLTVAFNSVQGTLAQIHPSLDAAARSLGASPIRMLHRVHLPMMQSTLLYATLLVFIDVMKELPATLVMRPFNFETLATRVYRLASDERLAEASTAALVIVALSLIPALLLMREQRATSSVQESSSSESPVR